MQLLMLTKVSEEGAAHFDGLSEANRAAGTEAHLSLYPGAAVEVVAVAG